MKRHLLMTALFLTLCAGVANAQIFSSADAAMPVPDNTGTLGTCQTITVPGGTGMISSLVTVEITSEHTFVGDLAFELTSPATTSLTVLNRPGRNGSGFGSSDNLITSTPILYHNAAASGVSAEAMGVACGGAIDGSAGCEDNYIPAPDIGDTPFGGTGTDLSDFVSETADGVWTLCVGDAAGGDTGTLTTWRLGIDTVIPVELESFGIE